MLLPEVEFLGHVVSTDGLKVAHNKVDAVNSWPMPTSVCDIQAFLSLANFYFGFVKGLWVWHVP